MTATLKEAGASVGTFRNWNSIDWKTIHEHIKRLQMRIAKAVKEKKFGRAKALQWLLTHSFYAKLYVASPVTCPNGINQKQPGGPARPKP